MDITVRGLRESASEYALRLIRDNIISLKLKPGSNVSESELARNLGISRTPVREALQELQKSNLIEIYPQRGCVVSHIDFDIIEETVFLRKVLEKAIVEELCDTITEDNMRKLEGIIQLQEFFLKHNSPDKILELDNEFHRSLYVMCNKERIFKMIEGTLGHFDRIRALSLYSVKEIKIVSDHKEILNAISQRNKELAAVLTVEHLSRYKLDQQEIIEKYPELFNQ